MCAPAILNIVLAGLLDSHIKGQHPSGCCAGLVMSQCDMTRPEVTASLPGHQGAALKHSLDPATSQVRVYWHCWCASTRHVVKGPAEHAPCMACIGLLIFRFGSTQLPPYPCPSGWKCSRVAAFLTRYLPGHEQPYASPHAVHPGAGSSCHQVVHPGVFVEGSLQLRQLHAVVLQQHAQV
jgi:hypothetical protein